MAAREAAETTVGCWRRSLTRQYVRAPHSQPIDPLLSPPFHLTRLRSPSLPSLTRMPPSTLVVGCLNAATASELQCIISNTRRRSHPPLITVANPVAHPAVNCGSHSTQPRTSTLCLLPANNATGNPLSLITPLTASLRCDWPAPAARTWPKRLDPMHRCRPCRIFPLRPGCSWCWC